MLVFGTANAWIDDIRIEVIEPAEGS